MFSITNQDKLDEGKESKENHKEISINKEVYLNLIRSLHDLYINKFEKSKFSRYMYDYEQNSASIKEFSDNIFYYLTEIPNEDLIKTVKSFK